MTEGTLTSFPVSTLAHLHGTLNEGKSGRQWFFFSKVEELDEQNQGSNLRKYSAFPSEMLAENLLVRTNLNFSELLMTCRITEIRLYPASFSGADYATF